MSEPQNIPYGYCHCGCGRKTKIARQTYTAKGHVKGEPLRWLKNHRDMRPVREGVHYEVNEDGCWVWLKYKNRFGYGTCSRNGHNLAYRYLYDREKGPIPSGMELDHLCRNRACVNPDHLEPVTRAVNVQRGTLAKLTWDDVRAIRASDKTVAELGRRYEVAVQTIYAILKGHTWKEEPPSI